MNRLLTLAEISEVLGVSQKTIYKWSHLGTIPVARAGRLLRFNEADVMEWLRRNKAPARRRQQPKKLKKDVLIQLPQRRADTEVNSLVKAAIGEVLK